MRLTSLVCVLAVAVLWVANATPVNAQQKVTTVHGSLVDVLGYLRDGIRPTNPAGKEIAVQNARNGSALAIIEKGTGKVFILAPSRADTAFVATMSGYFGGQVFVKGPLYKKGTLSVLVVEDVGKSVK